MITPELFPEICIFLEKFSRGFTLQILDNFAHGKLRRRRDEKMYVVFGNMAPENLDIVRTTNFTYQFTNPIGGLPSHDGFSIFRYPHYMIFQVKRRMRCFPV